MTSTTTLDVDAFVRAIEERDGDAQLAVYAPDASITLVDQDNPPSTPRILHGTDQLRSHLADVTGRDMAHQVRTAVTSGDHLALEVACTYPDGTRVVCMCVAGIADGRIAWARQVQSWDH
jgi:ketosteroid isomerase-like protein